ncbi:hypothetical protein ALC62_01020 [Cyphomyrmex costatus]|uniref:Uncharacterized protein n=2 Tax=Cyphomyrmex costatus TaxID=456900 RepID=A0A151IPP3_9HYME|nr:hypothetical protein ALC62_01020 [Cyphomyrmex costatus]
MLNTDGISLSRSSKITLYPLLLTICEVPSQLRSSFMILNGIWCDTEHPPMNMFLRVFVESLISIHNRDGVSWTHLDNWNIQITSVVLAPAMCADAPVRAQLQNIMSHTGLYSCNTCEQKMEKIPLTPDELILLDQRQIKRKSAFLFKEEPARLQTNKRMLKQARKAVKEKKEIKGVKGPSVLSLILYLDLSKCVFGEYMHLVCLGVVHRFMNLWFNVNGGEWYIGNHVNEINQLLINIRPPNIISRLPRGISESKLWKASEFRAFLLYYSLPILSKFLPNAYLQHWILFVLSIHLLLQKDIKLSDIKMTEIMLRMFVRDIGILYRPSDYVYNVHVLFKVIRIGNFVCRSPNFIEKNV